MHRLTNHKDSTVHLSSSSNHVLDVIRVPRTINVSVMPGSCLVFNVTGVNGNLPRFFFRSTINIFVGHGFTPSLLGKDFGDGLCKSSFAVIDMANGTDVDVRFVTVEFVSCGGKRTAGDVKSWSILRGQHTLGGLLNNGGSEAVHVGRDGSTLEA